MFRDIKRPIAVILVLYAIVGTLDFADQVVREAESKITLATN
jgi:hypothetical protein